MNYDELCAEVDKWDALMPWWFEEQVPREDRPYVYATDMPAEDRY